jgi:hypothetical protein
MSVGISKRKIFRKLRIRTEMASTNRLIGVLARPSAVGIKPIAPDASCRAQNEYQDNHKALTSLHHSDPAPQIVSLFNTSATLGNQ